MFTLKNAHLYNKAPYLKRRSSKTWRLCRKGRGFNMRSRRAFNTTWASFTRDNPTGSKLARQCERKSAPRGH